MMRVDGAEQVAGRYVAGRVGLFDDRDRCLLMTVTFTFHLEGARSVPHPFSYKQKMCRLTVAPLIIFAHLFFLPLASCLCTLHAPRGLCLSLAREDKMRPLILRAY
jgi:hypothetical protein